MPKYLIEIDELNDDCSYCPMFHRESNETALCACAGRCMDSVPCMDDEHYCAIQTFSIPDWCPLERVNDRFVVEHRKAKARGKSAHFVMLDELA